MPKNSPKLRAKDVAGKKIREQYFDGIVIGFLFGVIACTVFYLFDIENFFKNIINVIILFACFSPFLLLSFFNKFYFGKILCVFTEDKLYYFNAETKKHRICTLDETVTYLYIFEKSVPIVVTFNENGHISGQFLFLDDLNSLSEVKNTFEEYECKVSKLDID